MKAIVITGAIAVIAVGAVVYLLITPTRPTVVPAEAILPTATNTEVVSEWPRQGTGTLSALMLRGEALECTIVYTPDIGAAVEGTYFVADGQLRGDFITMADGMEVLSSMILSADTLYTWSEVYGEQYGMRIDLTKVTLGDDTAPDTREPVPLDEVVTYDCRTWPEVDGSVFIPPGDILFQDYSELMQQGLESPTVFDEGASATAMPPGTGDPCALCAQVPAGPGRSECLKNFSCAAE
jgi:hypothetical protein